MCSNLKEVSFKDVLRCEDEWRSAPDSLNECQQNISKSIPARGDALPEEIEFRIVELVLEKPALYNFKLPAGLRTKEKKSQHWQSILKDLDIPGNDFVQLRIVFFNFILYNKDMTESQLIKRWENIKANYLKRSRSTRTQPSGSGASTSKSSKSYDSLLEVLRDVSKPRP